MVNCCVPGCTNFSTKTRYLEKVISYHKIPSEPKIQRAWIARIRRENLPPLKNCYVCSEHFETDCFEKDLVLELTGKRSKRKLKPDAVPSIFDFQTSSLAVKRTRESTENRLKRRRQKEAVEELLASPSTSANSVSVSTDNCDQFDPDTNIPVDEQSKTVDVGVQCCLTPIAYTVTKPGSQKVTNTVSTQTNTTEEGSYEHGSHLNVLQDHTYSNHLSTPTPQKSIENISPQKSVSSISPQKSVKSLSSGADNDSEYELSESQDTDSSTDTESELNIDCCQAYVRMPKYLVFESCLRELFKYCINCGACVTEFNVVITGSLITVKTTCLDNHAAIWTSQPIIDRTPVGNLLLCSSILFTGNTFAKIQNFASCLGLQFISERVFYKHQERYLFPIVNDAWQSERAAVVEELSHTEILKFNGDGRCDSPGHNAKYGTYTFMDNKSRKVAIFEVVQVTETTSSNAMEKEGFVRCLDNLENEDLIINTITTDRHTSITSTMEKEYGHIKHQYDVWHLAKSVVKKLNKKAKTKTCEDLKHWIQSVSNHLWWCASSCNGDAEILREKWISILHHVRNKHSWNDATHFKRCAHPRLTRREVRQKCWLKAGTAAYVALEEVILKPRLLKDLVKLTDFCHTGGLEVFHSMMLKYCPKRQHFSYKGMVARTQLAAIDNNRNAERNQALITHGERRGEPRFNKSFPKMHKRWVVKPVMKKKSYDFLPELQIKVLEMCEGTGEIPEPIEVDLPDNIASEPAPDKQDLIDRHRSRFAR